MNIHLITAIMFVGLSAPQVSAQITLESRAVHAPTTARDDAARREAPALAKSQRRYVTADGPDLGIEGGRTVQKQVVVQAFCLDDRGAPHPAGRLTPDIEVNDSFRGELFRCSAGTRLQATSADYTGKVSFEGGQTMNCAAGDALYIEGGAISCRKQMPQRNCFERSLLRRHGPGVKIFRSGSARSGENSRAMTFANDDLAPAIACQARVSSSLAQEPLYADVVRRAVKLNAEAARYIEGVADNKPLPRYTAFKVDLAALSALNMQGHFDLKARGADGDLKCVLKGISEDLPKRLAEYEAATTRETRVEALKELTYLLTDNVEVISSPPAT